MFNLFIQKKEYRKGISLISLIIIITILMILAGVSIAILSRDDDYLTRTMIVSREMVEDNIKEYVFRTYSHILANPKLDCDPLDELESVITNNNLSVGEDYKYKVILVDKDSNAIYIEHQGIGAKIDLPESQENCIEASEENVQKKIYSVIFDYKDVAKSNQRKILYIEENLTIQQYLNITGENLPKETVWSPSLDLHSPITANKMYREN